MTGIEKLVSAIREGRLRSASARRFSELRRAFQEYLLRRKLDLAFPAAGAAPVFTRSGDFNKSEYGSIISEAFRHVEEGLAPLPEHVRNIEGMSGQKYRELINEIVRRHPDPRYLEIGSWAGSTATAAMHGNSLTALCIDNWSQFSGPKTAFFSNVASVKSDVVNFNFIEADFREINYNDIGSFNIFLFDGPHEETDHYDGVTLPSPALEKSLILIVDDWNWRKVRVGTFRAIADKKFHIEASIEIRTTKNNTHAEYNGNISDWHNGYFIALLNFNLT